MYLIQIFILHHIFISKKRSVNISKLNVVESTTFDLQWYRATISHKSKLCSNSILIMFLEALCRGYLFISLYTYIFFSFSTWRDNVFEFPKNSQHVRATTRRFRPRVSLLAIRSRSAILSLVVGSLFSSPSTLPRLLTSRAVTTGSNFLLMSHEAPFARSTNFGTRAFQFRSRSRPRFWPIFSPFPLSYLSALFYYR